MTELITGSTMFIAKILKAEYELGEILPAYPSDISMAVFGKYLSGPVYMWLDNPSFIDKMMIESESVDVIWENGEWVEEDDSIEW